MTTAAPFYHEVAKGPASAHALWARASDGVRLRLAVWPEGSKGTVLLFPGRTEYVEKYGLVAGDLADMGYATIAIDWRGQGLADRLLDDRNAGHVIHFTNYQRDVAVLLATARDQGLPEPYYLLAHSMGGCIGLRSLIEGLPVKTAIFSAPMWGIAVSGAMRPVAWTMAWGARWLHQGHRYTPGTKSETYVNQFAFEGNVLTTDPDQYAYMQAQVTAHPELSLGGPSMHWLYEALTETRRLARKPAPSVPVVTFLGSNERVVDPGPVHTRMAYWPSGELALLEGAEHEVLMEVPAIRDHVLERIKSQFAAYP